MSAKRFNIKDLLNSLRGMRSKNPKLANAVEDLERELEKREKAVAELHEDVGKPSPTTATPTSAATPSSAPVKETKKAATDADAFAESERIDEITSMELPMDWENSFATDERAEIFIEAVPDALVHCLNTLGRVDIEFISKITAKSCKEVIVALKGAIYQNPERWEENFLLGWELADEYLSGNLARKWRIAKKANTRYHGYFSANVNALKKLMPPSIATDDIYVALGSPWVPTEVIDEFIDHISGVPFKGKAYKELHSTRYDPTLGIWEVPSKDRFRFTRAQRIADTTYGTKRMGMLYILEHTLNMQTIKIEDSIDKGSPSGKKVRVINESETLLAIEKQAALQEAFRDWVWTDEKRAAKLQTIYDSRYGSVRKRSFDGSFLTLPGLNPDIKLYGYQKDAVARMILTPNTLLAHDVGSGKTFEMIVAGMEMRRMGISRKNLYVVPGNLTKQWADIFKLLYPAARLLVVSPSAFVPEKRDGVLRSIRDDDYDGIIMAYSCFDGIPLSAEYYEEKFAEARAVLDEAAAVYHSKAISQRKEKSLETSLKKAKASLEKIRCRVFFDELGINTLFVDEAHNYKNAPVDTKITGVLGISGGGSQKCQLMMDKVRHVQRTNGGRGVIFATGTPITNSITDIYVMQSYLQPGELGLLGLHSFDSWVGSFAEKRSEFEIDVDTSAFRLVTRFARFHNLPELTAILSSIADFHRVDKEVGLPDFKGYTDRLCMPTPEFRDYLEEISRRADRVRSRQVKPSEDNMLKITGDGKRAAIDLRLALPTASFSINSKVVKCAECIHEIYSAYSDTRATQLVFCDSSTPKATFNMYDELKRLLVWSGIPESEIAFVHDAETERARASLFAKVRAGDIRVLLGSTFKLGLGVNVQDRLIAIHHLDVPWRPADMVQREGRIIRYGNTNSEVFIYRYITESSFDAYSWQLLETKQRFIAQLLSCSVSERSGSDVDDTVLSYSEVKALAIGNPLIKKRVEVANELTRQLVLMREFAEERQRRGQELLELPARIARQKELLAKCEEDIAFYAEGKREYTKEELKDIRESIDRAIRVHIDMPEEKVICTYQGFDIIAPAYMKEEKPYVYVQGRGRYYLEIGTEAGILRRIDFFLNELERQRKLYSDALKKIRMTQRALKADSEEKNVYADRVDEIRRELKEIDERLGVKK